jgi:hypothetical protein
MESTFTHKESWGDFQLQSKKLYKDEFPILFNICSSLERFSITFTMYQEIYNIKRPISISQGMEKIALVVFPSHKIIV